MGRKRSKDLCPNVGHSALTTARKGMGAIGSGVILDGRKEKSDGERSDQGEGESSAD